MERLSVAQKSPKQSKANKKKPGVKVVYISNPMRVRTSESQFRAVVQELTGQDSNVAENMDKYPTTETIRKPEEDQARDVRQAELYKDIDCPLEMLEEALALPVLDNVSSFIPMQFYDYHQDGALGSYFDW